METDQLQIAIDHLKVGNLLKNHIDLAIKALEKQIPKKPNKFDGHYCKRCNSKLARQTDLVKQKYCHHCGQKLDWSEEGE